MSPHIFERMDMEHRFDPNEDAGLFQRKPLKEEIFEILHKRVIAGKYPPGEWLRQEDIASQLGVSQTPVREALDLLVSAGIAERVPYRGVRVLQLTTNEIIDSYSLRLLLESTAARAAARNRTQAQIDNLFLIVEKTKDLMTLNDMSLQRQLNREFHLLIVAVGGNQLMNRVYEMITNSFPDWMLYEYMFRHPELLESCLNMEYLEHRAIAEAIAGGNAELAAEQTLKHILNLGEELVTFLGIPENILQLKEQELGPLFVEIQNIKNYQVPNQPL
jgi:DNA-binding GntR family transcriptional regulator